MSEKISDQQAEQIIQEEMPEFQVVERRPSSERMSDKKPEVVAPDVQVWKHKQSKSRIKSDRFPSQGRSADEKSVTEDNDQEDLYELFLQRNRPADSDRDYDENEDNGREPEGQNHPQSKIVVVERKDVLRDRRDGASEPKGVVIDGKTRKIIGYQG